MLSSAAQGPRRSYPQRGKHALTTSARDVLVTPLLALMAAIWEKGRPLLVVTSIILTFQNPKSRIQKRLPISHGRPHLSLP